MDIENIKLDFLTLGDYNELKQAMIESYSNMPNSYWKEQQIKRLIDIFPEGQVVIKINNQIAGVALSIRVDYYMRITTIIKRLPAITPLILIVIQVMFYMELMYL